MLKIPTCWSFQNMSPLTIHAFHKSPKAKVCMWWEGQEGYCKPKTSHLVCIFLLFTAWDVCSCTWYTFQPHKTQWPTPNSTYLPAHQANPNAHEDNSSCVPPICPLMFPKAWTRSLPFLERHKT